LKLVVDEHWEEGETKEAGQGHGGLRSAVASFSLACASALTATKSTTVDASFGVLGIVIATTTEHTLLISRAVIDGKVHPCDDLAAQGPFLHVLVTPLSVVGILTINKILGIYITAYPTP